MVEAAYAKMRDNSSLKKGLKLVWFATGKDDFLLQTTHATVDLLKKHGFAPVYKETDGGHTWINRRLYLNEFAPPRPSCPFPGLHLRAGGHLPPPTVPRASRVTL